MHLQTVTDVINALGGLTAVGQVCNKSPQSMYNARRRNRFPPATYLVLQQEMARRGLKASPRLWGIREVRRRRRK